MGSRTLAVVGVAALLGLVVLIASLGLLAPLDDAVWRTVLFARDCAVDAAVERLIGAAGAALAVLVVAAVLLHARRHGLRAVWPAVALLAIGALTNEAMKDVFARERPSNLAGVAEAHGFPSGHATNSAVAALAVIVLAAGLRRPLLWRASALLLLAVVAVGRILAADHWLLDVVGALLTALALAGLFLPAFRRRPLAAPLALAAVLAAVLGAAHLWPALRVALPSPLDVAGADVLVAEVSGITPGVTTAGDWSGGAYAEPAGGYAWLRGSGLVQVFDPRAAERAAAGEPPVPAGGGADELLVLVARPDAKSPACVTVRVAVNGEIVASFVPFRGWREYRIPLPRGAYRPGYNDIQIAARAENGAPERLALARLRLRLP